MVGMALSAVNVSNKVIRGIMMIDIERLKQDSDYWNQVGPEGATHYWARSGDWYKVENDGTILAFYDYRWRQACHGFRVDKDDVIERPKPQSSEWDGEWLPPVGCVCEFTMSSTQSGWTECLVMGYYDDLVWITAHYKYSGLYSGSRLTMVLPHIKFRPIRTQAEREREELTIKLRDLMSSPEYPDYESVADAVLAWMKERTSD